MRKMTFYRMLKEIMDKREWFLLIIVICTMTIKQADSYDNVTSTLDAISEYTPWSSLLEESTIGESSRSARILLPNNNNNYVQHNTFNPSPPQPFNHHHQNQYIPANNYYFSNRVDNVETIEYDPKPHPTTTHPTTTLPPRPQTYQNFSPVRQNNYQQNLMPSQREITETDLFLLSAIEKLTFRVDYIEKRLKKTEQILYYIMEGSPEQIQQKPACPGNFTLIGDTCYFIGIDRGLNWKSAAAMCKSLGGQLAELDPNSRYQDVIFRLLNDFSVRGKDFWVGGLNPGLLWMWINSGKPVNPNAKLDKLVPQRKSRIIVENDVIVPSPVKINATLNITEEDAKVTQSSSSSSEEEEDEIKGKVINGVQGTTPANPKIVNRPPPTKRPANGSSQPNPVKQDPNEIKGDGRCLRLSYNPSTHTYGYTGVDCVQRSNYLCELKDRTSENEISRIAKSLNFN
uniref:CSON011101 protein n=1 Tax=Culicoides sonorensis TaxID=179676 RepID=A0A336LR83_CULSO